MWAISRFICPQSSARLLRWCKRAPGSSLYIRICVCVSCVLCRVANRSICILSFYRIPIQNECAMTHSVYNINIFLFFSIFNFIFFLLHMCALRCDVMCNVKLLCHGPALHSIYSAGCMLLAHTITRPFDTCMIYILLFFMSTSAIY